VSSVQPSQTAPPFDTNKIHAQLRKWQERLLDLKKSNPLLGLNRSRVSKLQVINPDATALFSRVVLDEADLRMPFIRRPPTGHGYKLLFDESEGDLEKQVEEGDVEFDASPADLVRRLRRIHTYDCFVAKPDLNQADDGFIGERPAGLNMLPTLV